MALDLESTIHDIGTTLLTLGKNITSMSTLKLTVSQWQRIREDLHTEHPKSVFMLKDKMRQVLGFTVREHNEYVYKASEHNPFDTATHEHSIRLDFYNERKYTMFLLKYSEYLNG